MCRSHPDGVRTLDGDAATVLVFQQVNRYDPRVTIMNELVDESTTHLFSCAGRIPTELGLLVNMRDMNLGSSRLTGTTPF